MKVIFTLKGFITIIMLMTGLHTSYVMGQSLDPPLNLTYQVEDENDVTLFWDPPLPPGTPQYLHWDDGTNYTSYGFMLFPETWDAAARWDTTHISTYDDWYITKMRFFMAAGNTNVTMKIWTGENATLDYSEVVSSYNVNDWTEIVLATPYQIDASTELWAGLELDQIFTGTPMGQDAGPAVSGYGDQMYYNGSWMTAGNGNWNIQIWVSPTTKASQSELLGYNVYRDSVQLNTDLVIAPSYVDLNLLNGTYDYFTTAVYDAGESDSSNHVEVIIDQPVILMSDSLALVELYDSCNGVNWPMSTLWLVGPVNEWYGITTEGTRVTRVSLNSNLLTGDIPESFSTLDALEEFWVSSNAITSLPDSVGNLTSLKNLWINLNELESLPATFINLSNLEQLNLLYNNLTYLPEDFGNLTSLYWLGLSYMEIDSLPSSFCDLISLENFFMVDNNLTALPDDFGNLTNLDYLTLADNDITELPASFGELESLRKFFCENNQLSVLPENFGNLSSLETLYLRMNQLVSLPENFGDLEMLDICDLSYNQLTALPDSIGNIHPNYFYIFNNQISEIPESMHNNTFEEFWTFDNFLQFGSIEPFVGSVAVSYSYVPQGMFGNDTTLSADPGSNFAFCYPVTGEYNLYQWFKGNTILAGQESDTLFIENVSASDAGNYTLKVQNTLATGLTLESHTMTLNVTSVGIDENEIADFNIYPNPVTGDQLFVEINEAAAVKQVMAYSSIGNIVLQIDHPEVSNKIVVSDWTPGLYIIAITADSGIQTKKVIIK